MIVSKTNKASVRLCSSNTVWDRTAAYAIYNITVHKNKDHSTKGCHKRHSGFMDRKPGVGTYSKYQ